MLQSVRAHMFVGTLLAPVLWGKHGKIATLIFPLIKVIDVSRYLGEVASSMVQLSISFGCHKNFFSLLEKYTLVQIHNSGHTVSAITPTIQHNNASTQQYMHGMIPTLGLP